MLTIIDGHAAFILERFHAMCTVINLQSEFENYLLIISTSLRGNERFKTFQKSNAHCFGFVVISYQPRLPYCHFGKMKDILVSRCNISTKHAYFEKCCWLVYVHIYVLTGNYIMRTARSEVLTFSLRLVNCTHHCCVYFIHHGIIAKRACGFGKSGFW